MLVVFSPIFVVDTKIIFGYKFLAPLRVFITVYSSGNNLMKQCNNLV